MAYAQNMVFSGLSSSLVLFTAPSAGNYFVDGKISLPRLSSGDTGPSAVVALIKKNGSTVYTGNAGAMGFYADLILAAGDAITLALTSANAIDAVANAVKTNVAVGSGL